MLSFPPQKLKEILVGQNIVPAEKFDEAFGEASRMGQDVGDVLVSKGFLTYDYLYSLFSTYLGVEKANLNTRGIDRNVISLIDEKFSRERRVIIFSQDADGTLNVAMEDPTDLPTMEFLEKKLGRKIRPYLATPDDLSRGFLIIALRH